MEPSGWDHCPQNRAGGEGQARRQLLALQSPHSSAPSPTMEAAKAWGGSGLLPDRHPV